MASRSKSRNAPQGPSPFAVEADALPEGKFTDPDITADGSPRAQVPLLELETLFLLPIPPGPKKRDHRLNRKSSKTYEQ